MEPRKKPTCFGILFWVYVLESLKEESIVTASGSAGRDSHRDELLPVGHYVVEQVQPHHEILQNDDELERRSWSMRRRRHKLQHCRF